MLVIFVVKYFAVASLCEPLIVEGATVAKLSNVSNLVTCNAALHSWNRSWKSYLSSCDASTGRWYPVDPCIGRTIFQAALNEMIQHLLPNQSDQNPYLILNNILILLS